MHLIAQQYQYSRRDVYQPVVESDFLDKKLNLLFVPSFSQELLKHGKYRNIKRLYFGLPPIVRVSMYDFENKKWKTVDLPDIE